MEVKCGGLIQPLRVLRYVQSFEAGIVRIRKIGNIGVGRVIADWKGRAGEGVVQLANESCIAVESEKTGVADALDDKDIAQETGRKRAIPAIRNKADRTLLDGGIDGGPMKAAMAAEEITKLHEKQRAKEG